jgi:hypothetical protein
MAKAYGENINNGSLLAASASDAEMTSWLSSSAAGVYRL